MVDGQYIPNLFIAPEVRHDKTSYRTSVLGRITRGSHYSHIFFIAYTFKGQVHGFAGRVKIVSHSSCRTSAILKYFCPLSFCQLGPSINRLATNGNTKLCCQGFVLALFQSTTAYKIDSEHTLDYTILHTFYVKWFKYENTLSHACKIFLLHDMLRHWVLYNSSNTCLRFLT